MPDRGWLKVVLDEAIEDVKAWPEWQRNDLQMTSDDREQNNTKDTTAATPATALSV